MTVSPEEFHDLANHCETCREDIRDRIAMVDRRLVG
jgi:hypothetical protein